MAKEKTKVILVSQSVSEFSYTANLEGRLEFVGMVSAFGGDGHRKYEEKKEVLDTILIKEAEKLCAEYVFAVKYQFGLNGSPYSVVFAYGDAYKVVEKEKTPFRD